MHGSDVMDLLIVIGVIYMIAKGIMDVKRGDDTGASKSLFEIGAIVVVLIILASIVGSSAGELDNVSFWAMILLVIVYGLFTPFLKFKVLKNLFGRTSFNDHDNTTSKSFTDSTTYFMIRIIWALFVLGFMYLTCIVFKNQNTKIVALIEIVVGIVVDFLIPKICVLLANNEDDDDEEEGDEEIEEDDV